jgi:hypothetical protein
MGLQLYHYGFGKVDSGEDMGAFFHPQFLRDEPALAFLLIGRRKDTKTKPDEQGTAEAGNSKTSSSSDTSPLSDSLRGFGMLESPFQALVTNEARSSRIERAHDISGGKERGVSGLLNQLSNEDQEVMVKHFRSDTRGLSKMSGTNNNNQSSTVDDEAGIGLLLFGDDHPADRGASRIPSQQTYLRQEASHRRQQQHQDWFSSIGSFVDDNSFDDDMFGVGFEPRPIEEMVLLSYNLRQNTDKR